MSESDYPVKRIKYIKQYLTKNKKDYIVTHELPCNNPIENSNSYWLEGGRRRYECYALSLKPRWIATIEPKTINWENIRQFGKVLIIKPSKMKSAVILWCKKKRTIPAKINWSQYPKDSPDDITLADEELLSSIIKNPNVLFARKVQDIAVANLIDKKIETIC